MTLVPMVVQSAIRSIKVSSHFIGYNITRFKSPSQLMNYLGLTPSEYSSGERQRRGAITKTDHHARRIVVEAAWAYRFNAKVSPEIQKRQENLPLAIREIAWKAQVRLCKRYRVMANKGKTKNAIVVSIARELAGFMWDIAPAESLLSVKIAFTMAISFNFLV